MVPHPQVLPTDVVHAEPPRGEGRSEEGDSAFNATPIVETPGDTIAVLRSMRVGMLELICNQKINTFDGYVVVADLVEAMAFSFQAKLCVDHVIQVVNRYGGQFFHIGYEVGFLAIKDKAPLTVPSVYSYQKNINLAAETVTSTPATGVEQPRSSYQEVSEDTRLVRSLRIGLKFLRATNRADTCDDGFVNLD